MLKLETFAPSVNVQLLVEIYWFWIQMVTNHLVIDLHVQTLISILM